MHSRKISEVIRNQKILTAPPSLSVREASRQMTAAHVGAIMVVDGDQLTGIFTERDALGRVLAQGRDPEGTTIGEVMTSNPRTAHPDTTLGNALHLMYDGGFRHVPVVERGTPIGMISARDALGPELCAFEAELQQRDTITELL